MRRRGRVDANQKEIVEALRQGGANVVSIANLGAGAPDLLVGYRGCTYLGEVKTAKGEYTDAQRDWHVRWSGGPLVIFRCLDDVIRFLGVIGCRSPLK